MNTMHVPLHSGKEHWKEKDSEFEENQGFTELNGDCGFQWEMGDMLKYISKM